MSIKRKKTGDCWNKVALYGVIAFYLLMLFPIAGFAFTPRKLTCENFENPICIEAQNPHLGWQIDAKQRSVLQTAYRVLVASSEGNLEKDLGDIWDSRRVLSGQSVQIIYNGSPLLSSQKYFWKVKVWCNKGNESEWSKPASLQMGLLAVQDWKGARWIGYEDIPDSMRVTLAPESFDASGKKILRKPVVPMFRKEFELKKGVANATLFISGLGNYEARLNGQKIGKGFLTPGWTRYDKSIFYNTWDVTQNLKEGKNVLGAIVGNGFYNINREPGRYAKLCNSFGMPAMICRLKITYTDGSEENFNSGEDWVTAPSPITFASIFGGEDYDARLEQNGWDNAGFDAAVWKPVILPLPQKGLLKADPDYPIAVMETFNPVKVIKKGDGKYLYDFGQNASGIVELQVKGKMGQTIRLTPGELITADKQINQKATGAPYYYSYITKGIGTESWQPRFTYYGFRYVMVEGAVPEGDSSAVSLPKMVSLKLLHTRNSTPVNGSFQCSSDFFNRVSTLINWGIKSNLQSVITDCPHREKLGWLEQTYLMGNSVNYNFNIYHLYKKQVNDMIESQLEDGFVPNIAPDYVVLTNWLYEIRDSPEWGSASVILPWLIYQWYGDRSVMETAWPMMVRYVEYLKSKSQGHILSYGLGDWCDIGNKTPGKSQLTPKALPGTAIYYYDLKLLTQMAKLLGKDKESKKFSDWAEEVKIAFNSKFLNLQTGVYATGSQTAMAMPLSFEMVEGQMKEKVVTNLVNSIIANKKALTAGDIGYHFLVETLVKNGQSQLLYEMNNRDDVPGYGYQLKKGATALTESWQAREDASNNHLMLGHLMQWFYESLGGIQQQENSTAYKHLLIRPTIVGDINSASASYETPYGKVSTSWQNTNNSFNLKLSVPANSTALVYLPAKGRTTVWEGEKPAWQSIDIQFVNIKDESFVYQVGSGEYNFTVK